MALPRNNLLLKLVPVPAVFFPALAAFLLAHRAPAALTSMGTLALARHDFRAGLGYGLEARRLAPFVIKPYGVVVDAEIELGRYAEAGRTLRRMVDAQPNLASYARVSYWRELHGD